MDKRVVEERYRRLIEKINRLPSLPPLVARLIEVVNSPESSADDAAELIEKDPALTGKLVRLANSAFYGMPRTISSVSSAVVILGFNTIRSVALSASVMNMFGGKGAQTPAFDYMRFWRHSIVCAMVARAIARRLFNFVCIDPESAFCAAVLHDIGRLIFQHLTPDEYGGVCRYARGKAVPLMGAEQEMMGITHARIGSILADKWALPIDLENALVFHHNPAAAPGGRELAAVVHIADGVCHSAGVNLWDGEVAPPPHGQARVMLRLDEGDIGALLQIAKDSIAQSDEFFAIMR